MNPATAADNRLSNPKTQPADERNKLYIVSLTKFVLLFALTAGGYISYWSYRNWACYKAVTGAPIMPVIRGVLWPFFILPLFDRVQSGLDNTDRSFFWQPQFRGLAIMLLVMFAVLVSTCFTRPSDVIFVFIIDASLIASCGVIFIEAQRAINVLGDDPKGCANNAFSCANIMWMVIGTLHMAFASYVVFMVVS